MSEQRGRDIGTREGREAALNRRWRVYYVAEFRNGQRQEYLVSTWDSEEEARQAATARTNAIVRENPDWKPLA